MEENSEVMYLNQPIRYWCFVINVCITISIGASVMYRSPSVYDKYVCLFVCILYLSILKIIVLPKCGV